MKIADLITAIKPIHIIGQMDKEQDILHLLTDSRELKEKGEGQTSEVLFFALKTAKNDGANYIPELYEKGVRAFVLTNGQWLTANSQWVMDHNDAVFVIVTDVLNALQDLAADVRSRFRGTVIGITGSNGKTVVKEWLYQLLLPSQKIVRSPVAQRRLHRHPLA